jgi:hypothetical protein
VTLIEYLYAQETGAKERQNEQRTFEKEHKLGAINRQQHLGGDKLTARKRNNR